MNDFKKALNYLIDFDLTKKYQQYIVIILANISIFIAVQFFANKSLDLITISEGVITDIHPEFVKYMFGFLAVFFLYGLLLMLNTYLVGYRALYNKFASLTNHEYFSIPVHLFLLWFLLEVIFLLPMAIIVALSSFNEEFLNFIILIVSMLFWIYQYMVITPSLFRFIFEHNVRKGLRIKENFQFARVNTNKFLMVGLMDLIALYTFSILLNFIFQLIGDQNEYLILIIDVIFTFILSLYNFMIRPFFSGLIYKHSLESIGIESINN